MMEQVHDEKGRFYYEDLEPIDFDAFLGPKPAAT